MEENEILKNAMASVPADSKIFISKLGDIAERVEQLLEEKGWSQKELAIAMGKNESEISKWLTNIHNFTLKSISKMEAALGADIIQIPLSGEISSPTRYVYLKVRAPINDLSSVDFNKDVEINKSESEKEISFIPHVDFINYLNINTISTLSDNQNTQKTNAGSW